MRVSEKLPTPAFILTYMGIGMLTVFVLAILLSHSVGSPVLLWLASACLLSCVAVRQGYVILHSLHGKNYRLSSHPISPAQLPSITIIVPCLNEQSSLSRTIPINVSATYPGILRFIYVVEPDSSDRTAELIESVAKMTPAVILHRKRMPASGHGHALDVGFSRTDADILGFMDADHTIDNDSLIAVGQYFSRYPDLHALRGKCIRTSTQGAVAQLLASEWDWYEATEIPFHEFVRGFTVLGGGHGFLRGTSVRVNNIRFGGALHDDIDLSLRLHQAGFPVCIVPNVQTKQEYPDTLINLFQQRRRWARGWWQLTMKFAGTLMRKSQASGVVRIDAFAALLVPMFCPAMLISSLAAISVVHTLSYKLLAGILLPLTVIYFGSAWFIHQRLFCRSWSLHRSLGISIGIPFLWFFYSFLFIMTAFEAACPGINPTFYKTRKGNA